MVIWLVMTSRINHIEELLISHGHAMVEGMIENSAPFSIPQIVNNAQDLKWIILVVVSGAYAIQYIALVVIVRRGLQGRIKLESRLRESYSQLKELAKMDSLTGLLNRRAIRDLTEIELSQAGREHTGLSLIFLDMDDLKSINDKYGHAVGDQALKLLADTIRATMRVGDWCGRWGGDEFLWTLPKINLTDTLKAAERFQKISNASSIKLPEGGILNMEVCLGISNVPAGSLGGWSFDDLFTKADRAAYFAKRSGGNRISHYDEVRQGDINT